MKKTSSRTRGSLLPGGALSLILALLSAPASAIVYTSSNESDGNRVIAFGVKKRSGQLVETGLFETGGTGTGPPLYNQVAVATDASNPCLYSNFPHTK